MSARQALRCAAHQEYEQLRNRRHMRGTLQYSSTPAWAERTVGRGIKLQELSKRPPALRVREIFCVNEQMFGRRLLVNELGEPLHHTNIAKQEAHRAKHAGDKAVGEFQSQHKIKINILTHSSVLVGGVRQRRSC